MVTRVRSHCMAMLPPRAVTEGNVHVSASSTVDADSVALTGTRIMVSFGFG